MDASAPIQSSPLVLVIDDEANFREILKMKLSAAGFGVEAAENGADGVAKARQLKPDLILLDMLMPVLDGAGTLAELKQYPETRDVKVVFLTSLGDPRADLRLLDQKFAQDSGAVEYFNKTESLDSLVFKIKSLLASQA